jgi:hypothetical protein
MGCGTGLGVPEMMRGGAKQAILSHDFREQQEQREGRRWHDAVQRQGQAELNMQAKLAAEHSRMRQRIREKKLRGRDNSGGAGGAGARSWRGVGRGARVNQAFQKIAVVTAKLNAANKMRKGLLAKTKTGAARSMVSLADASALQAAVAAGTQGIDEMKDLRGRAFQEGWQALADPLECAIFLCPGGRTLGCGAQGTGGGRQASASSCGAARFP